MANPRRFGFLLSVVALLIGSAAREASGTNLVAIRAVGSKRFTEAEIVRATGLKPGSAVSSRNFQEAANRLAATQAFADVRYQFKSTAAGVTVVFRVRDGGNFYPCRFENFVWFPEEELQARLRTRVPLFKGEVPLTGTMPELLDAALQGFLKERGIRGSVHHAMFGRQGGRLEALQFRVEGVTIPIRRVEFQGVTQLITSKLQEVVQPLLGTNYERSFVRDFAAANVTPLYWQRGFLRVAFGDPTVEVLKDDGDAVAVAATIPVREGLEYRLADIRWSGNSVFPSPDLAKSIHLKPGEPADAVQLQQDLEGIRSLYGTRGYLRASAESKPGFQDTPPMVSYEILIREGDLYRMGSVRIAGLDPSHSAALEKRWKLRSGEPYDDGYSKAFLSQIGPHLPRTPQGWKVSFKQSLDDASKTVNVTITILPKSTPEP